jgi:hypothetical protein
MNEYYINEKLRVLYNEILFLQTPKLKAEKLLELIQNKYENVKDFEFKKGLNAGLVEMHNELNKSELIIVFDFLIPLLKYFIINENFNFYFVVDEIETKLILNKIKLQLIEVIEN